VPVPILEVEIILKPEETLPADVAAQIADAAGAAFGSPIGGTWVRLRSLESEDYAENGGGPPAGVYPVFVSVLKANAHSADELALEIARLSVAIADVCDRPPENVHILYQPPARGRIAFGGRLLE
jgi:phenylpyruvate tautomerase PptA (4-oxalocrotonate tautomerase family)